MTIEKRILEIMEESKKVGLEAESKKSKKRLAEGSNPANKNAEAPEASHLPNANAPDNEANAKCNVKDQKSAEDVKSVPNVANASAEAGDHEIINKVTDTTAGATSDAAEPGDQKIIRKVNVQEDVAALIDGEDLSEEFKVKAATIFEAAVISRVKEESIKLQEVFDKQLEDKIVEIKESLSSRVDGYLDYVAESWLQQNMLAVESGIKHEIMEAFIVGMKKLFLEHYIEIPEEKYDVIGSMEAKIDTLTTKINEEVSTNIDLKRSLSELQRKEIVNTISEGLASTDAEKLKSLATELSFDGISEFKAKVETLKESYFTKSGSSNVVRSFVTDTPVEQLDESELSPAMSQYTNLLTRSI